MSIFDHLKKAAQGAAAEALRTGESRTFHFKALPESVEEMKLLPEAALTSPFETAALTVCALCAYAAVPEVGREMLNFLKGPQPMNGADIQFLQDRFRGGSHIPFYGFGRPTFL